MFLEFITYNPIQLIYLLLYLGLYFLNMNHFILYLSVGSPWILMISQRSSLFLWLFLMDSLYASISLVALPFPKVLFFCLAGHRNPIKSRRIHWFRFGYWFIPHFSALCFNVFETKLWFIRLLDVGQQTKKEKEWKYGRILVLGSLSKPL